MKIKQYERLKQYVLTIQEGTEQEQEGQYLQTTDEECADGWGPSRLPPTKSLREAFKFDTKQTAEQFMRSNKIPLKWKMRAVPVTIEMRVGGR